MKKSMLSTRVTDIKKAAFPVIDAHNHIWGKPDAGRIIKTMDQVGVECFCNLTGNVRIEFSEGGYTVSSCDIADFTGNISDKYPGRFYFFTMSDFAHPSDKPLFSDHKKFAEGFIETLHEHVRLGAKGLKVLKELGLYHRDAAGELIFC